MSKQDIITRIPRKSELTALKKIWDIVFGKTGAGKFFNLLFSCETAVIAEHNNKPAAMGYIIPAGELENNNQSLPCAMLYGIATLPEHRGFGYGAAVVTKLIDNAYKLGYKAVVLCPSEDSLFDYYSRKTKMKEWFYLKETVLKYPVAKQDSNRLNAINITPTEYMIHREKLLKNTPHINQNLSLIEYQKHICDEVGGGLYKIGDSCVIIEIEQNGLVSVKELLTPDEDTADLIACIANMFKAPEYIIRTPAKQKEGNRNGMIIFKDEKVSNIKDNEFPPWYGPAFD